MSDKTEQFTDNRIHRPEEEMPGEVLIPIFKDRISEAHKTSQFGFVMVKVPENTESFAVERIQRVMRKVDTFCIANVGTIIILIAKQRSALAVEAVVNKIKRELADVPELQVSGLFVPYPAIEYDEAISSLEHHIEDVKNDRVDVKEYYGVCKECNVNYCVLRDELHFTTCLGPRIGKRAVRSIHQNQQGQDDRDD